MEPEEKEPSKKKQMLPFKEKYSGPELFGGVNAYTSRDMDTEIMLKLAPQHLGKSKVISKGWSEFVSSSSFQRFYQKRYLGLILYWCTESDNPMEFGQSKLFCCYSPLQHLTEGRPAFSLVKDFTVYMGSRGGQTNIVNGLIVCVTHEDNQKDFPVKICNVFTQEKMVVIDHPELAYNLDISYHLGYACGEYKLLKLIFKLKGDGDCISVKAQRLILRPTGQQSCWKWIACSLPATFFGMVKWEAKTYSEHGISCWLGNSDMVWFDYRSETFHAVKLPEDLQNGKERGDRVFVQASFKGSSRRMALYRLNHGAELFVLEDIRGKDWRTEAVQLPQDIEGMPLVVAAGNQSLFLMNNLSGAVYGFGDDKTVDELVVGELPNIVGWDFGGESEIWLHNSKFGARLTMLHDHRALYQKMDAILDGANQRMRCTSRNMSYDELKEATRDFDSSMVLGGKKFGRVYRAFHEKCGAFFAVKKTTDTFKGKHVFPTEYLSKIGQLWHHNLVQLQGWCNERGELILVYEYMEGGSLDQLLKLEGKDENPLKWMDRFKIAVGIAHALAYLEEQNVHHMDIKSSNILLDASKEAMVGDLGWVHLMDLPLTNEEISDVFAFGVVLLELVRGRSSEDGSLVDLFMKLDIAGKIEEGADERLNEEFKAEADAAAKSLKAKADAAAKRLKAEADAADKSIKADIMKSLISANLDSAERPTMVEELNKKRPLFNQMKKVLHIGLKCTSSDSAGRPSMGDVLQMLKEAQLDPVLLQQPVVEHK